MYRFYVLCPNPEIWYAIMREANLMYGRGNWATQPKTLRKLRRSTVTSTKEKVWFDVPGADFGSWIGIKYDVEVLAPKDPDLAEH